MQAGLSGDVPQEEVQDALPPKGANGGSILVLGPWLVQDSHLLLTLENKRDRSGR